jgi:hypothetical protein
MVAEGLARIDFLGDTNGNDQIVAANIDVLGSVGPNGLIRPDRRVMCAGDIAFDRSREAFLIMERFRRLGIEVLMGNHDFGAVSWLCGKDAPINKPLRDGSFEQWRGVERIFDPRQVQGLWEFARYTDVGPDAVEDKIDPLKIPIHAGSQFTRYERLYEYLNRFNLSNAGPRVKRAMLDSEEGRDKLEMLCNQRAMLTFDRGIFTHAPASDETEELERVHGSDGLNEILETGLRAMLFEKGEVPNDFRKLVWTLLNSQRKTRGARDASLSEGLSEAAASRFAVRDIYRNVHGHTKVRAVGDAVKRVGSFEVCATDLGAGLDPKDPLKCMYGSHNVAVQDIETGDLHIGDAAVRKYNAEHPDS